MPNMFTSLFRRGNNIEEEVERQRQEGNRQATAALERRTTITRKVYRDLWRALKHSDKTSKSFVCHADLIRIWDPSNVLAPLAQDLDWNDQASLSQAKENFLCVMSILVWIKWDKWDQFGYLFLHHINDRGERNRTDKQLPFKDTSFLHIDEPLQISFKNEQYIFKPVVIIEDDPEEESEYFEYSDKDRLPFSHTEFIGRGGQGTVTKEEIPPYYFGYKNRSYNHQTIYVARKCFPGAGRTNRSFEVEQKNLKAFKKCLNHNANIMQSHTAFLHGNDFNIISPLADLDLHSYFAGDYHDFRDRSRFFSPAYLLHGAACLAGALKFLHEGLQPAGIAEKIYCAHLDLKPENILVQWQKGSNLPVGRWLLHDFGTSKIKESRNTRSSKTLDAPGDFIRSFSLTQASRTPGPFQAPEVQNSTERVVGTESDIWSLGCILAQVLTFALGGHSFITALVQCMCEGFRDDYFYDVAHVNYALKIPVVRYLDSLKSSHQDNTWIRETLELIHKILVKDPLSRPSAKEVQDTLERIYKRKDASLLAYCSWASESIPPLSALQVEPQQQPQQLPRRNQQPQRLLELGQRREIPIPELSQRYRNPEQEYLQPRPSLPQLIVRSPTAMNGSVENQPEAFSRQPTTVGGAVEYYQPGLEVVMSPTSSPRSDSISHFEIDSIIDPQRPRYSGISRSSSTSTRPVSLTEDVTFIKLLIPKNTFKSIICPSSCHVAFISKKQASIMRVVDKDKDWTKTPKGNEINAGYLQAYTKDNPDSFEWVDGCMGGQYIVLKAKRINGRDCKVYRYKCDDSGHTWDEDPIVDNANSSSAALDITVSKWGDVVFICDDQLWYYSTKYSFLSLATIGRHRIGSARFSPDGRWVFGWSHDAGINHFYKWDTSHHQWRSQSDRSRTLKRIWHIKDQPKSLERAGYGSPAIYPFFNYFVAFDRPDRVLTVGKHDYNPVATPVPREIRDVIGGTSVQGILLEKKIESLVLLQNSSGLLLTFPITHQGAGNPSEGVKLKLKFNANADALAVFQTGSDFYIVVSHSDGRLERRRISST